MLRAINIRQVDDDDEVRFVLDQNT